ncbi:hypothetical protein Lalb_Chr20g0116901 [Lupinus albus]|uniref:Uncharacterized protein n=1 Tax=Lupinus albus TaxID=3870 RepID=A0A6A4NX38_LUPAL|nr:hypothetical protein Lalb_Chr20g0116901 [Lupinus albus]
MLFTYSALSVLLKDEKKYIHINNIVIYFTIRFYQYRSQNGSSLRVFKKPCRTGRFNWKTGEPDP